MRAAYHINTSQDIARVQGKRWLHGDMLVAQRGARPTQHPHIARAVASPNNSSQLQRSGGAKPAVCGLSSQLVKAVTVSNSSGVHMNAGGGAGGGAQHAQHAQHGAAVTSEPLQTPGPTPPIYPHVCREMAPQAGARRWSQCM